LTGNASMYVFRVSRKQPHARRTARGKFAHSRSKGQKTALYAKIKPTIRRTAHKNRLAKAAQTTAATKRAAAAAATRRAAVALNAKAEAFVKQGAFDNAIQTYRKALAADAANKAAREGLSDVYTMRGEQAADTGNAALAISQFQEAVKFNFENAAAHAGLGEVFDAIDDRARAIVNFEKALEIDPELVEIYYPLGVLHFEGNEFAKAEAYFKSALPTRDAADAEIQNYMGLTAARQGRDEDAILFFQKAIELKSDYAEAYFNLGEALDRLNRFDDAIAAYRKALEINPRYAAAQYNLGVAYYNRERYEEAAAAYRLAVDSQKDDLDSQKNLADSYRQLKQFDSAVMTYKNVIALNTEEANADRAEIYSKFGYCLGKANQWDESVNALHEAVRLETDAVQYANLSWGYSNAAKVEAKAKNAPEAQKKLLTAKVAAERSVELDQNFDAGFYNLGNAQAQLGEGEAAIESYKKAINLRSNWAEAYNGLGVAYRLNGDFKSAVEVLNQALGINDDFADAHANIAVALLGLNNKKEARKHMDAVKRLNPTLAVNLDGFLRDFSPEEIKRRALQKIPGKNKVDQIRRRLPF
jgi:superkiller protein 3